MSKNVIKAIGHVFYPESCPLDNVLEHILDKYNCCISPIHDRDLNKNGTLKKPHYHMLFQGNLSEKDKKYISKITTMNYFEQLYDLNASYDYLYHWCTKTDWFLPNKAQYWSADIIYSERWTEVKKVLPKEDLFLRLVNDMTLCYEFSDFVNFLTTIDDMIYREYCLKNYHLIDTYIRSNRNKSRIEKKKIPDSKIHDENFEDSTYIHNINGEKKCDLRTDNLARQCTIENEINFPIDVE